MPQTPTYPVKSKLTPNPPDMAARFVFLATRAVWRDIEKLPAEAPSAMYAYDPSIGRLAVSTRRYNCAIVPQTNGAFPYGGIDLCRLADADQRVAASIGGTGSANFGVIVSAGGRGVVASATPRTRGGPPPLTMTKGPRGRITAGESYPASPYAGRFSTLEVTGTRSAGGVTVRATNNFTEARIVSTWVITRGSSAAALTVDAHFPSYGAGSIFAVSRGGRRTRLTPSGAGVRLAEVAYFHVVSEQPETGYVIVPRRFPAGRADRGDPALRTVLGAEAGADARARARAREPHLPHGDAAGRAGGRRDRRGRSLRGALAELLPRRFLLRTRRLSALTSAPAADGMRSPASPYRSRAPVWRWRIA